MNTFKYRQQLTGTEPLEKMFLAQADGSYRKLINKLSSASLLILDDWD